MQELKSCLIGAGKCLPMMIRLWRIIRICYPGGLRLLRRNNGYVSENGQGI